MWKVLKWIFGFSKQYHAQKKQYRKSGVAGKIITLIFILGLCGLMLWLEVVAIRLYSTHWGYAILLSIFVVASIVSLAKTTGVYSVVAFLNIIHSTTEKFVEKKAKEELTRNYEVKDGEIVEREKLLTDEELAEKNIQVKKQHRWLDVLGGILYVLACLGIIIIAITILMFALQGKIK